LHEEIEDFVRWVSPTDEEKKMRQDILNRINAVVHQLWPQARVEIIGSYKTELCLPTSDVDLVVFGASKDPSDVVPLFQLSLLLEEKRLTWTNGARVITTAKVPIIKFQDIKSRCFVDIAFEVNTGFENTKIVQSFLAQYPLLRPLSLVIKYYLKQNFLNDTWSGGIGSYTLVILILSYLQNHTKSRGLGTTDGENLADLLIGFFDFYGRKFDYTEQVISVKDKCYYNKKTRRWFNEDFPHSLSVEDPHNPEIDVGSASFQIIKAKAAFEEAYLRLTDAMKHRCMSYLAQTDIVNAQFVSRFREHIKEVYAGEDENLNKKRYIYYHPKPGMKGRYKYPRKTYKNSHDHHYTWENQLTYRPKKVTTDDFPTLPPLLDKNTTTTSQHHYTHHPRKSHMSPNNRCWNKLDLQNRKTLTGVSAVHN